MQIVTLFSPTRQAGRTTALLALASGLLADGKRIGVIKLTEHPVAAKFRFVDPLFDWEAKLQETYDEDFVSVSIVVNFETLIRALCLCEFTETDVVLVDTTSQQSKITDEALDRSDLIIVPFTDPRTAELGAKWASRFKGETIGLATGFVDEKDALVCQRKFTASPALEVCLPNNQIFQRQLQEGCIFEMEAKSLSEIKNPIEDALFRVEAMDACLAAEEFSLEVFAELQTRAAASMARSRY